MHSVTLDGSPRKRTLSRGLSEDESLRSIIKETETSSRRLTRSDSRAGALKKSSDTQQSDQDLFMGLPEILELQASYDEVVQELRGLEVEREALLFQVDVLQDTLEGVEELLAEAQREAGQASLELEREREAKKKLESMVSSLMQEVERLKEESNNKPSAPASTHGSVDEVTRQEHQELLTAAHREDKDSSLCEDTSESQGRASEEVGQGEEAGDKGSLLTKLRKMVSKPLIHLPSLALDNPISEDGVLLRPCENGVEEERDPSPERNDSDSISAYEDASADTPEQERMFPDGADPLELLHDSEKEKSSTNNCQVTDGETQDPKNPDACVVS
ncbi:leucine-rich repeat flightless-interacting protein 2 [Morone saxatilis]|uniref:leucine-rich repeat flightless-interacting protein 2 n=1 Tax=Morone saxatilis TaxID=34816 RepID=UPI0015E2275F|nr:leucine-rich repeat flightless-interacting protein 2 [Morone saxatilis]